MKVAYVANRFPRLRGGWIFNEVRGLLLARVELVLVSFKPPIGDVVDDPAMRPWRDRTLYVPRGLSFACLRAALSVLLRSPGAFFRAIGAALRLGGRNARGTHILEVVYLVALLKRRRVEHVHAQHADYVADAALAAARALRLPYSFAAHAKDLYTNPGDLIEKIRSATFVATCTRFNETYLRETWARANGGREDDGRVSLCYHGVDLERFAAPATASAAEPPPSKLISIARLEEKKGYPYLLDALARLREKGVPFSLDLYGEGNERGSIERRVRELDLGGSVSLKGGVAHDRIPDLLRASGIYVLPCIVLANKDRDGIPNTILEALACGVPVVSTSVSGIPEVIEDGRSGLLVPERDPAALAAALERMMTDAELRARCRAAGREIVESAFSVEAAGRRLARLLKPSSV